MVGTSFVLPGSDESLADLKDWCYRYLDEGETEELLDLLLDVCQDPQVDGCKRVTPISVFFISINDCRREDAAYLCRSKGEFLKRLVELLVAHSPVEILLPLVYDFDLGGWSCDDEKAEAEEGENDFLMK